MFGFTGLLPYVEVTVVKKLSRLNSGLGRKTSPFTDEAECCGRSCRKNPDLLEGKGV